MRGIVLAGGAGTRLYPLTQVASKQLQPVYDKPMIYYPLATLMHAGVVDILLISSPEDIPRFEDLLGDGSQWGISIEYAVQAAPTGIAEALIIGEEFLAGGSSMLILGDNIFYGNMRIEQITRDFSGGALIFGYRVRDPERYGIVEIAEDGSVLSLEEKPAQPKSKMAVPGLYLYDANAPQFARELTASHRGELEITDLNLRYLAEGQLTAEVLGRGIAWLDSGTHESLLESAEFIATIEARQGLKISCLEEIAFNRGLVSSGELRACCEAMPRSPYRSYVEDLLSQA